MFGVFNHAILLLIIIIYKLTLSSLMEAPYRLFMLSRYVPYLFLFNYVNMRTLSVDILIYDITLFYFDWWLTS